MRMFCFARIRKPRHITHVLSGVILKHITIRYFCEFPQDFLYDMCAHFHRTSYTISVRISTRLPIQYMYDKCVDFKTSFYAIHLRISTRLPIRYVCGFQTVFLYDTCVDFNKFWYTIPVQIQQDFQYYTCSNLNTPSCVIVYRLLHAFLYDTTKYCNMSSYRMRHICRKWAGVWNISSPNDFELYRSWKVKIA